MKPPNLSPENTNQVESTGAPKRATNTDRHRVLFRKGATEEGIKFLRAAGYNVAVWNSDYPMREDELGNADAIVYPKTGVAIVAGEPGQLSQIQNFVNDTSSPIQLVKPERVRYAVPFVAEVGTQTNGVDAFSADFLSGYKQAFSQVLDRLAQKDASESLNSSEILAPTQTQATWGLQATRVLNSPFSGRGIKVAVLDTGIDFTVDQNGNRKFHPDFAGRTITTASFVNGVASAKDGHGHGTHCIGTACGPRQPAMQPRYGVAFEAEIFAGKVLNDQGSGADGWIMAGIEWAINNGCQVISMSLGSTREVGEPFDPLYEELAQRALAAGTLIVAAAGNSSSRPDLILPVGGPADCPSIMAVAAVDSDMQIATFSDAGINANGGEVNIAAPGVKVLSSFPMPTGHRLLSGTSMATPHVAGIAALYAQANPTARGKKLWDLVVNAASALGQLGARDVGRGMVQAPVAPKPSKPSPRPKRAAEDDVVGIQQTSPITVGGGGSVGVNFDSEDYLPDSSTPGSLKNFVSVNGDLIEKLRLIDKFGSAPDRTPSTVDCRIVIHCEKVDPKGNIVPNSDSPITIHGSPLSVEFNVDDYPLTVPPGGTHPLHYAKERKITQTVDVFEDAATDDPTVRLTVPTQGICTVDVLNNR